MFSGIYPVIMCGGSGSRLWPLSRSGMPKQFLPLKGDKSLFVQTLERVARRYGFKEPIIIANSEHRFLLSKQAGDANLPLGKIILEPMGRNTAPAVIIAALEAAQTDPEAKILVLSADHLISDVPAFHEAVERAAAAANNAYLTCFGIHPTSAETGYGYIKPGTAVEGAAGAHLINSFREKPDAATAQAYLASKEYLWNSGMFMFSAQQFLEEARACEPAMFDACKTAFDAITPDLHFHRLPEKEFSAVPDNSIDYAIMEKTTRAAVVPCSIGWSDLGSFSALHDTGEKDARDNVTHGDVTLLASSGCFVHSDGRLITATDINNLVVVATDDAVMIAPKDKDQNVKNIVNALKKEGRDEAKLHTTVYRPWGFYTSLAINSHFQVKELCVYPGKRLSLQSHNKRAEHWVVVEGEATVTRNDDILTLKANESVFLPVKTRHRLENKGERLLRLIEVQTGTYFGEDDIIRYEDDFMRERSG
ncbi:mannose-1-phosphate guanylyltransferase/mannose-6-phosphate isomerase [Kordiimonas aestuarii]|uniref:mannose-1-phosphate guanylyltransferase/mannose-6-phosphate isomerase n=1 Tax=Kordiimonas aestuarii TaxID=1005925 RepID=UPI0021CEE456|nr:mannose-1-phosphate guanylyltransferase/mannose-6-phosphate isomerase [Kordiimonas aestuarii]